MQKKLTITIDEHVYARLHSVIGPRKISGFIEHLVRPHVLDRETDLERSYREMAEDEAAEAEALEWSEALMGDVGDEPW
jgi:predicted CopG family antitoxin